MKELKIRDRKDVDNKVIFTISMRDNNIYLNDVREEEVVSVDGILYRITSTIYNGGVVVDDVIKIKVYELKNIVQSRR